MSMFRMSLDGLEGRSRDWPKFSGKVLGYAVWKKEWQRHHHDKYKDLKGDSLKRIMLERCLPAEVKERVLFNPFLPITLEHLSYLSKVIGI